MANVGGAFFGSMPGGGGTTQTAVNRHAGARTQFAEIVTAGVTLVTMLFLAPLIALMPHATLAAVVIVYSIGLIQPSEFRGILSVRRTEFNWALVAFAGVVLLGTLQGIIAAIAMSLLSLLYQDSDPPVYVMGRKRGTNVFRSDLERSSGGRDVSGLLILRVEGRVFFANAEYLRQKIKQLVDAANPRCRGGLKRCPGFGTALKCRRSWERHRQHGVSLWLVGVNPEVRRWSESASG